MSPFDLLYNFLYFNITNTISMLEFIWVVVTFIGFVVCGLEFLEANYDRKALLDSKLNGRRKIVANMNTRNNFKRVLVQSMFLVAGGAAMLAPKISRPEPSFAGVVIIMMLMFSAIAMTVVALYDRRDRLHLMRYALEEDRRDLEAGNRMLVPTLPESIITAKLEQVAKGNCSCAGTVVCAMHLFLKEPDVVSRFRFLHWIGPLLEHREMTEPHDCSYENCPAWLNAYGATAKRRGL